MVNFSFRSTYNAIAGKIRLIETKFPINKNVSDCTYELIAINRMFTLKTVPK